MKRKAATVRGPEPQSMEFGIVDRGDHAQGAGLSYLADHQTHQSITHL
ncbi:unnamed protein product [[Actinomadura] parvosata subsp. kistnae]|nr:unnamed protein product [Actinomadura parvosata subsp. kistnae]